MLTGMDAEQPAYNTNVPPREITNVLEVEFAAAWETGSRGGSETSLVPLAIRPLEEYSDEELFAASDAVFSLLDDPEALDGPDLLGRYNDIGQEILRRTPLSEILNPAGERQTAS
jgi:hypothetical protein